MISPAANGGHKGEFMEKVKNLVVGAGLSGAVLAERIASQLQEPVLVIDRREHIAGNIYDSKHSSGITVHRYGPHIFHTNKKEIWDYLDGEISLEQAIKEIKKNTRNYAKRQDTWFKHDNCEQWSINDKENLIKKLIDLYPEYTKKV